MKTIGIDVILLAIVGAVFINLSFDTYQTNWLGLIVGGLLMLPGVCMAVRSLW